MSWQTITLIIYTTISSLFLNLATLEVLPQSDFRVDMMVKKLKIFYLLLIISTLYDIFILCLKHQMSIYYTS